MPKKILEIWELEAAQMLAGMLLLTSGSRSEADIGEPNFQAARFRSGYRSEADIRDEVA